MSVEPPPREWRFWSQTSVVTRNIMSEVMRSAVSLLGKRSPHKEEDLLGLIDPSPLDTKKNSKLSDRVFQNDLKLFTLLETFQSVWKLSGLLGTFTDWPENVHTVHYAQKLSGRLCRHVDEILRTICNKKGNPILQLSRNCKKSDLVRQIEIWALY